MSTSTKPTPLALAGSVPTRAASGGRQGYLYNPWIDFLCLGGGSLIVLAIAGLFMPHEGPAFETLGTVMLVVANFVNHPHFAHSYQIFYGNYRQKAFGRDTPQGLRFRYAFAGLAVPALLVAFFSFCWFTEQPRLLGLGGNLMLFLVGWHYVKQGYGMLMVDCVLKKKFFSETEKRILLTNAYVVWAFSWLFGNYEAGEKSLFGFNYFVIPIPQWAVVMAGTALFVTSLAVIRMLWRRRSTVADSLPFNGLVAYGVSLYIWLVAVSIHPALILLVPAFHSLQYLAVVWRFEANRERGEAVAALAGSGFSPDDLDDKGRDALRMRVRSGFAAFVVLGTIAGLIGFWGLPMALQIWVPYDQQAFGANIFLVLCWIFINVHHYFLDSVMWRRENPEVRKYLFV